MFRIIAKGVMALIALLVSLWLFANAHYILGTICLLVFIGLLYL